MASVIVAAASPSEQASRPDGTILFYQHVRNAIARTGAKRVLDFGAGRGGARKVRDLRDLAEIWACDVDVAVLANPYAHRRLVVPESGSSELPAESFDVILCDAMFEHLADPEGATREMLRLLRPGGEICARTPNRWGYPAIAARLIPNRLHKAALRRIQPDRPQQDIFPTRYRLNTPAQVRRYFPGCEVSYYYDSAEPSYCFGSKTLYRIMEGVHAILPERLSTSICFLIRKVA
jgi:SAM-dependent methyltransferase